MLTQFKMDCRLHKADFLVYLLGELGGFLLGVLLLILIMRTDKEAGSWFCLGTMMALVATTILVLFIGGFGYSGEFQLAIAMGRTRGAFMGSYALRLLLQIGVSYLLALALYRVELAVYPLFFPAAGNETPFQFLTDARILIPAGLRLLILAMFLGAVYGRYGKKGMWVFYVFWLFGCLVLPRLTQDEFGSSILNKAALGIRTLYLAVAPGVWVVLGMLTAAAMTATIIALGKKQMVRL